ncbi:MAG: phosphoglycerate kinase [Candidatus Saccharimonadales bacterium]
MNFSKQTIRDIKLSGKRVLLRADYNVPLRADGKIAGDYRIRQSLPTIEYLIKQGCKIVIISHMGRPKTKHDKHLSLRPVARHLQDLLGKKVAFAEDCIGPIAEKAAAKLEPGQVLLLENLRFHPEEEANDKHFVEALARLGDIFVQDGFGVVHRVHASTEGITHALPSVAGLLLDKEVTALTGAMDNPKRPLMAIIGGAKITDKIGVIKRFIEVSNFVVIGGAMANTFLQAQGVDTGRSVSVPEDIPLAKDIIALAKVKAAKGDFVFYIPQDGVVAASLDSRAHTRIVDWQAHVIADIENYPKRPPREASKINKNELILDVGPFSGAFIAGGIQLASTVIWNGTMGVTEVSPLSGLGPTGPFAHGTELIVEALLGQFGHRPFSIVGGGDTVSYVESRQLTDSFNHVSTGGGASLELMSGKKLPGIEALKNK